MGPGRCRECGKEVSSNARACPHCGAPVWVANCLMNVGKVILIVVVLVAIWLCRQLLREIYPMLRTWLLGAE